MKARLDLNDDLLAQAKARMDRHEYTLLTPRR